MSISSTSALTQPEKFFDWPWNKPTPTPTPTPTPKPIPSPPLPPVSNTTNVTNTTKDLLCNKTNTVNSVCTIANQTLVLKQDLNYTSNNSLVIQNSTLACLNGTTPCSIYINMNNTGTSLKNLTLKQGS